MTDVVLVPNVSLMIRDSQGDSKPELMSLYCVLLLSASLAQWYIRPTLDLGVVSPSLSTGEQIPMLYCNGIIPVYIKAVCPTLIFSLLKMFYPKLQRHGNHAVRANVKND